MLRAIQDKKLWWAVIDHNLKGYDVQNSHMLWCMDWHPISCFLLCNIIVLHYNEITRLNLSSHSGSVALKSSLNVDSTFSYECMWQSSSHFLSLSQASSYIPTCLMVFILVVTGLTMLYTCQGKLLKCRYLPFHHI